MFTLNPYLKSLAAALVTTVVTIVQDGQHLSDWHTWTVPVSTTLLVYLTPNQQKKVPFT